MNIIDESVEQGLALQGNHEAKFPEAGKIAEKDSDSAIRQMFRGAARLTAQVFLLEAEGLTALNPNHQPDLEQEHAMAQQELSEGDAKALADDDETAIEHYRKAWLHASSAHLQAFRIK